jgi:ribosomal protein S9
LELDIAHKLRQPPAPNVPAAPTAVHVAVEHLRNKVKKDDMVTAAIKAVNARVAHTTGGADGKKQAMRAALSHALRLVAKRQADNDMDQVAMDKIGMSIADMELPRKKRPPSRTEAAKPRRPPPPALAEKGKKGGGIRAALATRMTRA